MPQAARVLDNLPLPLNRFIGRTAEISALKQRVWSTRLLTLTGPGGCGKTRLALKVAEELRDAFGDGAWMVELASLSDATLIARTIMTALNMHEQKGRTLTEALIEQLQPRELLLVLDNCEHLIDSCANLAQTLLQHCSGVRILATSREALNIAAEITWLVPPLSMTDPNQSVDAAALQTSEAARLFLDRATAARADFAVSDQDASAIAQICRQLDGMPLAIELAAARVKVLRTAEIAARLDDRFHLLMAGSRAAPARHQTLRAAIDWSYDLLSEPERVLLRRLSVFAGGCTLEAAEQVCSDQVGQDGIVSSQILDLLSHLVDKSLIIVDKQDGETRYHMLETIRQYAQERLAVSGETEAVQRRHAEFFTAWVEQMTMELRAGPTQLARFAELEAEQDNIGATLEWSLGGANAELGLRLVGSIFYFWWRCGHWVEWGRWVALAAGHIEHVSETARAGTLTAMMGWEYFGRREIETASRHGREALTIYRQLGDRRNIAWAIILLVFCSTGIEDAYIESIALTEEAIAALQQEGDLGAVAQALTGLGLLALAHGDLIRAKAAHEESLTIAVEIGDQLREIIQLSNLGNIALAEGNYETAAMFHKRRLWWGRELGNSTQILSGLAELTGDLGLTGNLQRAARLMGAVDTLPKKLGVKLQMVEQSDFDRYVALVRGQLGAEAFETLWDEGRALTLEQAIEFALETPAPREEVAQLRTLRQAAKQKVGGLTAREREVAALIAQGKSNREIAAALVLSERTIEGHVSNIFNKLGFNARTQIAAWAVEKGLAKTE